MRLPTKVIISATVKKSAGQLHKLAEKDKQIFYLFGEVQKPKKYYEIVLRA